MVRQNSTDWLRNLEILSLLINIISWPVFFLFGSLLAWYGLVPLSNDPLMIYLGIILGIFLGIIWDTQYGPGGIYFIPPFKNFLKHSESKEDRIFALVSLVGTFGTIAILYGMVLIIIQIIPI